MKVYITDSGEDFGNGGGCFGVFATWDLALKVAASVREGHVGWTWEEVPTGRNDIRKWEHGDCWVTVTEWKVEGLEGEEVHPPELCP